MVLIFLISLACSFENAVKLHKSILVKFFKLVVRYHILIGIKIIEIAEAVSCGISNFTVVVGNLLKNFGADTNICVIICRSNPQAKNICAEPMPRTSASYNNPSRSHDHANKQSWHQIRR